MAREPYNNGTEKAGGDDARSRRRMMSSVTITAVLVALILVATKTVAWIYSGSVVILSSLVDSGLDALASLVNFMAVRHALTPADREHRFGHGKSEALAGLAQSAIIAGSAIYVVYEATRHLMEPRSLERGSLAIGVMVLSMVLTVGLVAYQRFVIRRTGSVAVSADSLHYVGDILMNAGVILALVLATYFDLQWADPIFALAVAVFILASSRRIFASSLDIVLDRELPDRDRERIIRVVTMHPEVIGMHDLRTRWDGTRTFIQFHIELDPKMDISRAHAIMDDLEAELHKMFDNPEIIIHGDPYGIDEDRAVF